MPGAPAFSLPTGQASDQPLAPPPRRPGSPAPSAPGGVGFVALRRSWNVFWPSERLLSGQSCAIGQARRGRRYDTRLLGNVVEIEDGESSTFSVFTAT